MELPLSAVAIRMARADRVDWLLHIDTDELVYPAGSPGFSLQVRCAVLCCPEGYQDLWPTPQGMWKRMLMHLMGTRAGRLKAQVGLKVFAIGR